MSFNIAQQGHVVNILPPVDINGGKTSDYVSMENYSHADIIITIGVNGGAGSDITIEESDDSAGNNTNAIAFKYAAEETAAGDTLSAMTDATSTGFTTHAANSSITYVIGVDDTDLTDGYPYLVVKAGNPGASVIGSMVAVLTGARYGGATTPSAIE